MKVIKTFLLTAALCLMSAGYTLGQTTGSISGQVVDSLGAVVIGATVQAVAADGKQKEVVTNDRGEYSITGLAAGTYTVKAIAPKFALYENTEVVVVAGQRNELIATLTVEGVEESVDVSNEDQVNTDPTNNASATVIKGQDLDALPDDPDELEAALQALAGASAGPNGGQIYIDGFTGGRLPPKDSIREIRVNQNPFSAEFDRLGFGRIEILTKPGTDKWRGQLFANFNDESLNSRNPFAINRAPSQTRFFGGNISGPIQKGRSSFFLDINNRKFDNNSIINALVLDPTLAITGFTQDVQVPTERFSISPRFDYAINDKNTLIARYSFTRSSAINQGIGDTSLPSRAYDTASREHEIRLTETMIINPTTVNETRFEYTDAKREQNGDNSIPTVNVPSAFIGGGSQIGLSFNRSKTWELSNYTTTSFGSNSQHSIKFGGRLRHVSLTDRSENNYGGTFLFPGVREVRSPAGCFPLGPECIIVVPGLSSIDQYQGEVSGNPGLQFNPTQFTIVTGDPVASVSRFDAGLFISDDWRVSPSLVLSFGLRYENQTNINSNFNFAPRFGFAWSPGAGGAKAPKTVFRGGAGIFYERFSENLTLQAERFDGSTQLSLLVSANDPDPVRRAAAIQLLSQPVFNADGTVTNVPTAADILEVLPQSNTIRQVSPDIDAPYTMQAAFGVERQLPARTTLAAFFITSKTLHQLRSRNINAPVCDFANQCIGGSRPDPNLGDVNAYESTGVTRQNQFIINFRTNISPKYSLFGNYRLGYAEGDTDGAGTFPAYSYDLSGEYGRSSFDIRHSFMIGGNISVPWGVSLNPFIIANSGRPFNITRGLDVNGDGLTTERPTFAELISRCAELGLNASYCSIGSNDPNAILPRNYGDGPTYFSVNLRVSRNFGFGGTTPGPVADAGTSSPPAGSALAGAVGRGGRGGRGGGGGGGGGRGGRGGFAAGGDLRKPYNLNVGVSFNNLFNNVNLGLPQGILNSSRFGQSTSTSGGFGGFGGGGGGFGGSAANRRVELQLRFTW